jgi:hypothetical protein
VHTIPPLVVSEGNGERTAILKKQGKGGKGAGKGVGKNNGKDNLNYTDIGGGPGMLQGNWKNAGLPPQGIRLNAAEVSLRFFQILWKKYKAATYFHISKSTKLQHMSELNFFLS